VDFSEAATSFGEAQTGIASLIGEGLLTIGEGVVEELDERGDLIPFEKAPHMAPYIELRLAAVEVSGPMSETAETLDSIDRRER